MTLLANSVGNIIVTGVITWTLQRRCVMRYVSPFIPSKRLYDSLYCRVALATRLLRGLKCYHITAAGVDTSKLVSQSTNILTQRLTKQQAAKAKKRDADLGEAGTVTSMPASPTQIEATKFYSQLDTLARSTNVHAVHQAYLLSMRATLHNHVSAVDVPGRSSNSQLPAWGGLLLHRITSQLLSGFVCCADHCPGATLPLCGEQLCSLLACSMILLSPAPSCSCDDIYSIYDSPI